MPDQTINCQKFVLWTVCGLLGHLGQIVQQLVDHPENVEPGRVLMENMEVSNVNDNLNKKQKLVRKK